MSQKDVCSAGANPPGFETLEQARIGRKCRRRDRSRSALRLTNLIDERRSEGCRRGGYELPAIKIHEPFLIRHAWRGSG